ncbi:phage tail tape measure protein, partial [Pseudomonas aeruginosa]
QQELLSGLASAVQATQQQSRLMADQHQQLLGQLKQVSDATAQSSKHMDSSANQLGLLSANLRQAADSLGQRLEAVSHSIERAGQQNAELGLTGSSD